MKYNPEILCGLQKTYCRSGATKEVAFRKTSLAMLKNSIKKWEKQILMALKEDLGKGPFEAYMTEVGVVYEEIDLATDQLESWAAPRRVKTPLHLFPGKSMIYQEPYGSVLILSAWNYPFQLAFVPLVGALASGNCAVVKMASQAPSTAAVVSALIQEIFDPEYVACMTEGGPELLQQPFDYIFYTGGAAVGRLVMEAAAKHLTPVTLELGGKSPCIVDETANISLAAKRILFGKLLNSGQTCVAPDYVLVTREQKELLTEKMIRFCQDFYGENPLACPTYPRIVNQRHFQRLTELLEGQEILWGGSYDRESLKFAPTLVNEPAADSPLMTEEIFGPILPIIAVEDTAAACRFIEEKEKPLALYFFTENEKRAQKLIRSLSFGGGCINDTVMHLANSRLPFGGVGQSGMGSYHGQAGFATFSHAKSIFLQSTKGDIPFRYPPFTKGLDLLKKLMK